MPHGCVYCTVRGLPAQCSRLLILISEYHGVPVRTCTRLEYKEIAPLGSGNFSRVYKVKCRFDGMVYAAKRTARALRSDADRKRWQQVGDGACQLLVDMHHGFNFQSA